MLEKYSSSNPAYRLRPGFRFAFSAPSHAIALFFGAGCLRPGPGTWGSLAAALVFLFFETLIPASLLWVPGVLAFLIGVWAAGRTGDDLGVQDAGAIVIDEVAAVWLLLAVIPRPRDSPLSVFLTLLSSRPRRSLTGSCIRGSASCWMTSSRRSGRGRLFGQLPV